MRSIGGDGGNRNVKGQGREEESNAPQIASGTWSWNNPFLHRLCGHFTDFLDYFLHLFIYFFVIFFASFISRDLIRAGERQTLEHGIVGSWEQYAEGRSWKTVRARSFHFITMNMKKLYKKQTNNNKNNRKAAIWALSAKDINIFMSLCCNHVSMNGFLIYHHSKVSLLWWDLRF